MNKGTKFLDVLVYAALDNQKDANKSRISVRTIAKKYNISLSKVENAIKRLKEAGYIDYTQHSVEGKDYVFNEYTFPVLKDKCGFLMLKSDILFQKLKPKERGLLIYLQLIAMPGLNELAETKIEDIASRLKITRQTTSKYLKYFEGINQITKGKYFYKCHYLATEKVLAKKKEEMIIL